jgi:hypothetical protein
MSDQHPSTPELDQIKKELHMIKPNNRYIKKYHKEVKAGTREAKPAELAEIDNLLIAMNSHHEELHDRLQKHEEVLYKVVKDLKEPTKAFSQLVADLLDNKHDLNDPATKQSIQKTLNYVANAICDVYKESTGAIPREVIDVLRMTEEFPATKNATTAHLDSADTKEAADATSSDEI